MEKPEEPTCKGENEKQPYETLVCLFRTLVERKRETDISRKESSRLELAAPEVIYTGTGQVKSLMLNPDGNFITWQSFQPAEQKRTIVPSNVTESGFTDEIPGRSKIGTPSFTGSSLNIFDLIRDTLYQVKTDDIPGINDAPDYVSDFSVKKSAKQEKELSPSATRYGRMTESLRWWISSWMITRIVG